MSKHSVLRKTGSEKEKEKYGCMQEIFTTGTKDKTDPSTSATTNCQLRIGLSRRACLNKPVNMAFLTRCNGEPCQAKCCVFSSQVTANWFYTAASFCQATEFIERQLLLCATQAAGQHPTTDACVCSCSTNDELEKKKKKKKITCSRKYDTNRSLSKTLSVIKQLAELSWVRRWYKEWQLLFGSDQRLQTSAVECSSLYSPQTPVSI